MNVLRSMFASLLGQIVPIGVAAACIPNLLGIIGKERFGILMLFMVGIGYFGILDGGLSKAVTRRIALLGADSSHQIPGRVVGSASIFLIAVSIVTGVVLWAGSSQIGPWISGNHEKLTVEVTGSVRLVAFLLPLMLVGQAFRGYLEGIGRFDIVSWAALPTSAATYVFAIAAAWISHDLQVMVLVLCVSRILNGILLFMAYRRSDAIEQIRLSWNFREIVLLSRSGGWLGFSMVFGPIIVYMDRFAVSTTLGPGNSAIYSTVQELLFRFLVIPAAIVAVAFPKMARLLEQDAKAGTSRSDSATLACLLFVMGLMASGCMLLGTVGPSLFEKWIRVDLGSDERVVFLAFVGVLFFNSLSQVPISLIQARGRAKVTALLHVAELVLLVSALAIFVPRYGLVGAAYVSLARVLLDFILLWWISLHLEIVGQAAAVVAIGLPISCALLFLLVVGHFGALGLGICSLSAAAVAAFSYRRKSFDEVHDLVKATIANR